MIDSDRIVTSETERSDIQEGDSHQVHSIPDFASPTAPITSDASKAPPSLAERNRQLTMRLRDAERALADEQKHHQQTQTRLWNREQEVGKLRREKVQATNELDRFIHHSQVFTHLTDEQIIQEATQLRCDVRDFTLQRVRSDKHLQISQDLCKFMSNYLKISQDDVRNYLQPPQLRPSVVQAFLWAFLHGEVFHRYAWLAPEAAKAMLDTRSFLYPLTTHASEAVSEGQRKFHMWRANTSTLLLNIVNLDIQRTHDMWRDFSEEKAGYICQYLGPLLLPKNDLEDQLADSGIHDLDIRQKPLSLQRRRHGGTDRPKGAE
ncbi:hypothetical protein BDW59DRAFT_167978 [Aspergillus cavernicola]|uniref:BZIP transcription factor n=1 Tax=Aspergillus cavernicola TaxID=176166 RepID=A0ABR4H861_9EURO